MKEHYEDFERVYPERYEKAFGQFRPVIRKVFREFLSRGDLRRGFAQVRCPWCGGAMRIVAFIEEPTIIGHILRHVGLWEGPEPRPPPIMQPPATIDIEYIPCFG